MLIQNFVYRYQQQSLERSLNLPLITHWSSHTKRGPYWMGQVSVKRSKDHPEATGFAIDTKPYDVCKKAMMKALESLAIKDAYLKTKHQNGFASHLTLRKAKKSAYRELIETDAFLYHWLSETPGISLQQNNQKWIDRRVRLLGIDLQVQGVELLTAEPKLKTALIAAKNPKTGAWLIGLGCKPTLNDAIQKALLEFLGSYYKFQLFGKFNRSSGIIEFETSSIAKSIRLHEFNSNEEKKESLIQHLLFSEKPSSRTASTQSPLLLTEYQVLPTHSESYHVVRAKNSKLFRPKDLEGPHQEKLSFRSLMSES